MKVLIVDDSLATLEIIKRSLEKFSYRKLIIEKTNHARKAMHLISTWKPDIVLTDWNMPDMSGLQLINVIKQQGLNIKVAMITTVDEYSQIELAMQAGALFVLSKPFEDNALHEQLLPLVQELETNELLLNQVEVVVDDELALPKLSQLEKLIHKHISEDLTINSLKLQSFDESKLPCIMAIYEDPESQKVRAVGILDVYATCIMASSLRLIPPEEAQQAIHKHIVSEEILASATEALNYTALAFLDNRTRRALRIKLIKFVPSTFPKLEALFKMDETKRIDFSCQRDGMAQGKVLLVGL